GMSDSDDSDSIPALISEEQLLAARQKTSTAVDLAVPQPSGPSPSTSRAFTLVKPTEAPKRCSQTTSKRSKRSIFPWEDPEPSSSNHSESQESDDDDSSFFFPRGGVCPCCAQSGGLFPIDASQIFHNEHLMSPAASATARIAYALQALSEDGPQFPGLRKGYLNNRPRAAPPPARHPTRSATPSQALPAQPLPPSPRTLSCVHTAGQPSLPTPLEVPAQPGTPVEAATTPPAPLPLDEAGQETKATPRGDTRAARRRQQQQALQKEQQEQLKETELRKDKIGPAGDKQKR
ncbi:hypothetical protein QJQ45_015575, partial [Haematococcus lacustris]